MCIYIYILAHTHIYMNIYTHLQISISYTHSYSWICMCVYIYIHICCINLHVIKKPSSPVRCLDLCWACSPVAPPSLVPCCQMPSAWQHVAGRQRATCDYASDPAAPKSLPLMGGYIYLKDVNGYEYYVCIYIYIHSSIHIYIYIHMHIYIYMHKYKHI